ncbi:modifier of mdg4-like [Teleopsis dalmanni]|uniref:modifier of mdg4-like n=1 Tax=Teleopsis dalmanni TaxID=139649 RepID=UPI0018CD8DE2|nr:modifier of mdg4-like [Teleopsis dalmanni]
MEKIHATIRENKPSRPVYASTTKGGMKLIYDGHHFRYSFRKGQYSIFQCCYKENKEECKVRVVSDQKRVYPLDGEHVHYMLATDKSVTSVMFEPDLNNDGEKEAKPSHLDLIQSKSDEHETNVANTSVKVHNLSNVLEIEIPLNNEKESKEFIKINSQEEQSHFTDAENPVDFREKLKKRLQKVLLVIPQFSANCRPQKFIISQTGTTLLVVNDFLYRSKLRRLERGHDTVYWECIHNRLRKCRSRIKTMGNDLYLINDLHNHASDIDRIEEAEEDGLIVFRRLSWFLEK